MRFEYDNALFESDERVAAGEFSLIFGYSNPAVQTRYLEYQSDRDLPGVIVTLRMVSLYIFPVWLAVGAVLSQIIPNYSWLQFALAPSLHQALVYCMTLLWARGILDLYWKRFLVVDALLVTWIISASFGLGDSLFPRCCGNLVALEEYYGRDAHSVLQWTLLCFASFHLALPFTMGLGVVELCMTVALLMCYFVTTVYVYDSALATGVLTMSILPMWGLLFFFPTLTREEMQRQDFQRKLFFDQQTKALEAANKSKIDEDGVLTITDEFVTKMDTMITDGSLREVYFKAGSTDPDESRAARAQLSYFLTCMDRMTSSPTSSSTNDSSAAGKQVLRRLKTAGTALRIADRWFNKLKLDEHEDKVSQRLQVQYLLRFVHSLTLRLTLFTREPCLQGSWLD
jgi:hypothetical protein